MAKPKLALIPAAQGSKLFSVLPSSGVGDFTFTRSGKATRINSQGLIEEVADGVSRLNYPMIDGKVVGCPHHILEPQRTNSITYSEDFSQSNWTKSNTTITSNSVISPDGTLNASKLTDSTANGIHRLRDSVSLSADTDYSLSIFAKKGTLSNMQLALVNTSNSSIASRVFDLENGILGESLDSGASGTLSDSKITDYGNGWYRCEITAQLNTTPNQYQITLATQSSGNSTTNNQVTYDGDGNGNVYLWGAMLEQGSFPTSYIPTNGSAVTRAAEVATGSGDAATFNDSEGVLMAEISALANDGNYELISISDGTNNIHIDLGFNNTTTESYKQVKFGGDNVFGDFTDPIADQTTPNKMAIKYKSGDSCFYVNGFKIDSSSTAFTPNSSFNELKFSYFTGGDNFYGNAKQVQYFDSALTDSELEQLTSWTSFTDMANGQLYTIE